MKKLLLILGILFANPTIYPMNSFESDSSSLPPSAPTIQSLQQDDTKIIEVSFDNIKAFCAAKKEKDKNNQEYIQIEQTLLTKFPLLSSFYKVRHQEPNETYKILNPVVYQYIGQKYTPDQNNSAESFLNNDTVIGLTRRLMLLTDNLRSQHDSNLQKAEQELLQAQYTDTAMYGLKQLGLMGTGVTLGSFLFGKNIFSSKSSAIIGSLIALIPSIITTTLFVKNNNSTKYNDQKTVIASLQNQLANAEHLYESVQEYAALQESVIMSSIPNIKVASIEEHTSSNSTSSLYPTINTTTSSTASEDSSSTDKHEASSASNFTSSPDSSTSSSTYESSNRSFFSRIFSYFGW